MSNPESVQPESPETEEIESQPDQINLSVLHSRIQ